MTAHKISVKFYVDDPSQLGAHEFVPIFHSWIQDHANEIGRADVGEGSESLIPVSRFRRHVEVTIEEN